MSSGASREPTPDRLASDLRDVYEEFELQENRVAMISDPENEHAWIQSNRTLPVET